MVCPHYITEVDMKVMNLCAALALSGFFIMTNADTASMEVTVPNGKVTIEADCTKGQQLRVKRQIGGDVRSQVVGCRSSGSIE